MKVTSILINMVVIIPLVFLSHHLLASPEEQSNKKFFSLVEIKKVDKKPLEPLQYIAATDDVTLAYRAYLPQNAQAILIFYHGAGAHSGLTYNHIGVGLRDNFDIAVYMPDIRGHGGSAGERGDAPDVEQVWSDVNEIVSVARDEYPNIPIFIGGHSSGAGLVLNYASWDNKYNVDGYVFLAPYFGFRSETNYDKTETKGVEFSSVTTSDFIINTMSGGLFLGHAKAVKFNFPDAVLLDNPEIVPFNTVNMSNAVTPYSPGTQLSGLTKFGLWIGNQDEAFDPVKVTLFAENNSNDKASKKISILDDENHFSIMLKAASHIGPWLKTAIK